MHGCNAQGVMGSGLADVVKRKYPAAFKAYRAQYLAKGLRVGDIVPVVISRDSAGAALIVVNAITQKFYGRDPNVVYVDYDGLESCFVKVRALAEEHKLTDIHFPLIGCGLANGKWPAVSARIVRALGDGVTKHLWVKD
ncbi:macro domain-containing protein [Paraburkholderia sp. UCT31]|uniref:macro domain-containing protein n=1 Tax=Paraburkholderia sp. UCT31 TaxID=2615209 RepID=UPI001CA3BA45|nr:macro domain-containing protein [Paraburkholderia sp. UCT31]